MARLTVCKFGGSSVTSQSDVSRIEQIVKDDSVEELLLFLHLGKDILTELEKKMTQR